MIKFTFFGGGFISHYCANCLNARGHQVLVLQRREMAGSSSEPIIVQYNRSNVSKYIDRINGSWVIVCAAMTPLSEDYSDTAVIPTNLKILEDVYSFCETYGAKGLVHLSSTAVFGETPPQLITPDIDIASIVRNPYGQSKFEAEILLQQATSTALQSINLRLPGIIWRGKPRLFIPTLVENLKSGGTPKIYSADALFNGILTIPSLATILTNICSTATAPGYQSFNLACRNPMSLKAIVEQAARFLNVAPVFQEKLIGRSPYIICTERLERFTPVPTVQKEMESYLNSTQGGYSE